MFSKKHKVFFQITAQGIKFNRIVASTGLIMSMATLCMHTKMGSALWPPGIYLLRPIHTNCVYIWWAISTIQVRNMVRNVCKLTLSQRFPLQACYEGSL
jgi:hypothetical protein